MARRIGLLLMFLAAGPLVAQERRIEADGIPEVAADEVIAFFNRPSTIRFQGRGEIPAGQAIVGDVAVLGGPFEVAGEVRGDLVVLNGDLIVHEGGRITGTVTVVGGRAIAPDALVDGPLTVYARPLPYRRSGSLIAYDERGSRDEADPDAGRTYVSIRTVSNYNRVEGLPVMFGPVFRTAGEDYLRVDALAIWKSESGLRISDEELGYSIRAEQHFGPDGRFLVGGSAHSRVEPIESMGFRDIEASLGAFLLHQDYRDYVSRQGFGALAGFSDAARGIRLTAEYRDEDHRYVPPGSPWTLRRNEGPWRPQPLVGEGRLRSFTGTFVVDARNDIADPTDGWYLEAAATSAIGGSLVLPEYRQPEPQSPTLAASAVELGHDFQTGSLDLRRYARLGPGAVLALRGFLAGALDDAPLPPQFQRALGGEGTLPGYPTMSLDCGARSQLYSVFRDAGNGQSVRAPAYAAYGCDRVALFQAEYTGSLSIDLGLGPKDENDEGWDWYPVVDFSPSWSLFFDAGRGWTSQEPDSSRHPGGDSDTLTDVGVGLRLGDLGMYWAWPLRGAKRDVNFFLRIDHRF